MRLVQHKKEAYWFYRFLSVFYDKLVNPLFWTPRMRDECQVLANLDSPGLQVVDVGSGTGFNTQGIVRHVAPENVTCVDQSPHQMAKARKKPDLQGCTFLLGDAECLPLNTGRFDRYLSAGSIEYWPHPQQGINEAYRVVKPGGLALVIGPLEPKGRLARWLATLWMLFPTDEQYHSWMQQAGFTDIRVRYTAPHWVSSDEKYGIAIVGTKPRTEPIRTGGAEETVDPAVEEKTGFSRNLLLAGRVLAGSLAGFLFIPAALFGYLFSIGKQRHVPAEYRERLNIYQISVLILIGIAVIWVVWRYVS